MEEVMIYLSTPQKIQEFVDTVSKFDCDFDLYSGKYMIDGKSIMGIFSLNISKPINLRFFPRSELQLRQVMLAIEPFLA